MKSKLEYIWLDGYKPTQNMRSKTKIIEDFSGNLEDCPIWSFDGLYLLNKPKEILLIVC